jgi:hypothetical protein
LGAYLVEATDQDPELLVIQAADQRSGDLAGRIIPTQILDIGIVRALCDTRRTIDGGLGESMTGRGFFGQVLSSIRSGCRRRRIVRVCLSCRVAYRVQVLVDDTGAGGGF